jgi:hypothetical protein
MVRERGLAPAACIVASKVTTAAQVFKVLVTAWFPELSSRTENDNFPAMIPVDLAICREGTVRGQIGPRADTPYAFILKNRMARMKYQDEPGR